jgi:redox-regulated HSP33 family molecular chaperone
MNMIKIYKSIIKYFHRCYHDKPIIARYRTFSSRDIIFECRCGHRQIERVIREYGDPFPIEPTNYLTHREFESYLNN